MTSFNQHGGRSCGVLGVTVGDVAGETLKCHEDPLPNNLAHVVVSFRGISRGQCECKSKALLACAERRGGYLFQLPLPEDFAT